MNVIVNGACGRMGGEILRLLDKNYHGASLAAAVDPKENQSDFYRNINNFTGNADVIIDFSSPAALPVLLAYAVERSLPIVIATTGHSDADREKIREAAARIPLLHCANTSIGIVLMTDLVRRAVAAFPEADVEIVETHHNRKADAPSGTALILAKAVQSVRPNSVVVTGRSGASKRQPNEITISAVRRGNIVGTHEVYISTDTQTLTLTHEAHDRALFAEGAIAAAEFIVRQNAGLYSMQDLID